MRGGGGVTGAAMLNKGDCVIVIYRSRISQVN